ncbi:MAG: hypothetical protein ABSB11_04245 [Sedimentisphaerales bacterium]|jgi:hypothetical protein
MDCLNCLKNEKYFLELAFQALKDQDHFKDRNYFEQFYKSIKTDSDKDLFLRISSLYLFLVKKCSITNDVPNQIDYISNTFKYIAIFSLIEGLYSSKEYIDFFEFLMKKSNQIQFPITEEQLRSHYDDYKKQYGAIRKAVAFFKQIEDFYNKHLKGKIKFLKDDTQLPLPSYFPLSETDKQQGLTIDEFAKFLYDIRSKFMHQANLILMISNGTALSFKEKYLCQMNMNELMDVFEKGLLKFFEAKQ